MLKLGLEKLLQHQNLTADEMQFCFSEILKPENKIRAAAFLSLLRAKGETPTEIVAMVRLLRQQMLNIETNCRTIDIVGTGGDGANTVNISTGAALLAASCGVNVIKHGSNASSSLCGSADVLAELGVDISMSAEAILSCVERFNFGFCYAPKFHPALSQLKQLRRDLGVCTTINLLGPLLNPANADILMLGVLNKNVQKLMAEVLCQLGVHRALVYYGEGTDELTTTSMTHVIEINKGESKEFVIDPREYGFTLCQLSDLVGGDVKLNAKLLSDALQGKVGPISDTLILNAGVANYLYGLTRTIKEGVTLAAEHLKMGLPHKLLQDLAALSQSQVSQEVSHG